MAPLPELLASLKRLLADGGALASVRFPAALFENLVVEKELAAIHQTDAAPQASALYRVCIEGLATREAREELAWLAAAARADGKDAAAVELLTELLRSSLGALDNPILKLIFAAQYAGLVERRHSSPS